MENTNYFSLAGKWDVRLSDDSRWEMTLPGTLDENQIGYKDVGANQWHPDASLGNDTLFDPDAPIATRLTRRFTYEGAAVLTRTVDADFHPNKRIFLEVERARCLKLSVDGKEIPDAVAPTISTPHVFEVTGLLHRGAQLALISDNSYPDLPHDAILYSSAATDETQTNWNGALGYVRLRTEDAVFIESIRVYPRGNTVSVILSINAEQPYTEDIRLRCAAFKRDFIIHAENSSGIHVIKADGIELSDSVERWDEYEGRLYTLTASLKNGAEKTVSFGVRDFGSDESGRLTLNGRRIFLRSEANCAVFPETGHPPMTEAEWIEILNLYKSYGVNMMRFHSHCPPEAAFAAADRIGMLMQPELSHWNPKDAFEAEDAWQYYQTELRGILETYANHPSFVMLTLGNELWPGDLGRERMNRLLDMAHKTDSTRLYANGSNVFYGSNGCDSESDFYTSMGYYDDMLRGISAGSKETNGKMIGHINNRYPNAQTDYETAMAKLRQTYSKPVFGFEVGQFEVLPDFDELSDFKGVTDPANLRIIRNKMQACDLEANWKRYVEATGELSRIGYREEVEAVLRTPSMSGLSLLGLQDFPGQGTALVGMLNTHLKPKPFDFAKPERFHAFFREQLPLALLEKYTYSSDENLCAKIMVANYGKNAIEGALHYTLCGDTFNVDGTAECTVFPTGELTCAGEINIPLADISIPSRLNLVLRVGDTQNSYPIWVYPPIEPKCPEDVYQTESLDAQAEAILKSGGKVFLAPKSTKEALPSSVQAQFTSDFWSVGTFPWQSGTMGQLIDEKHPLFRHFPTEFHTNWQWWPMATQRAAIVPQGVRAIITEMDSYTSMRPMAQLFECNCENGKLLFSSMGLSALKQYPEVRALLNSIYSYMDSTDFAPTQSFSLNELSSWKIVQENRV